MKHGFEKIIGRTVSGVVVASNPNGPQHQVFVCFADGTAFEIYGESFSCADGLDTGGLPEAIRYAESMGGKIERIYPTALAQAVSTEAKQALDRAMRPPKEAK